MVTAFIFLKLILCCKPGWINSSCCRIFAPDWAHCALSSVVIDKISWPFVTAGLGDGMSPAKRQTNASPFSSLSIATYTILVIHTAPFILILTPWWSSSEVFKPLHSKMFFRSFFCSYGSRSRRLFSQKWTIKETWWALQNAYPFSEKLSSLESRKYHAMALRLFFFIKKKGLNASYYEKFTSARWFHPLRPALQPTLFLSPSSLCPLTCGRYNKAAGN